MGTVVRDWRLATPARRRSRHGPRSDRPAASCQGFELHAPPLDVGSRPRTLARVATVLVTLLVVVLWLWWLGAERRAVRALPPAERAAVFAATLRELADLCAPPRAGLERHCTRQASFLMSFPECDEHCQSLTRPILQWRS